MSALLKVLSIICALAAAFLTAVIVYALVKLAGGNYTLKPGFAAFAVGAILLSYGAVVLWRRSRRAPVGPGGPGTAV
jgi:high-affinity Fe2+/Pb2+ permease